MGEVASEEDARTGAEMSKKAVKARRAVNAERHRGATTIVGRM
jgi:hypothetical protein